MGPLAVITVALCRRCGIRPTKVAAVSRALEIANPATWRLAKEKKPDAKHVKGKLEANGSASMRRRVHAWHDAVQESKDAGSSYVKPVSASISRSTMVMRNLQNRLHHHSHRK